MSQKRFFPNLNGVRFIAAFMVLIHHVEQAKQALGLPAIYHFPIVQHAGRLGVGLFFVLSGFLITYLLIQEKNSHGNIAARKFYLRRIFRIWPIYFVIVLSSYFLFPHIPLLEYPGATANVTTHYWERLLFLVLVLPNFAFVLYDLPYWCAQAWSIGVEEQFYYLWPWLLKYPKRRVVIIIAFLGLSALLLATGLYFLNDPAEVRLEKAMTFLGQFRIQIMALGGFLAWAVYADKKRFLAVIFRKDVQIGVYLALLVLFLSGVHFTGFMEVYGLFFGFFIVNVSCNPHTIIRLEHPWISYLGRISYGLYLYHVVVVVLVINVLNRYGTPESTVLYNFLLYTAVTAGSVLLSSASFEYFEKPLLRFKDNRFGR